MIVADRKPMTEILEMIKDYKKILFSRLQRVCYRV